MRYMGLNIYKNSATWEAGGIELRSLDKLLLFVVAFTDWNTECEKTVPTARVHTHYSTK